MGTSNLNFLSTIFSVYTLSKMQNIDSYVHSLLCSGQAQATAICERKHFLAGVTKTTTSVSTVRLLIFLCNHLADSVA